MPEYTDAEAIAGKGDITLTSRFGRFIFSSNVILSHAKLIRDSVCGQYFTPKTNEPKIRTEVDVYNYVRNHCSSILAEVPFTVVIDV